LLCAWAWAQKRATNPEVLSQKTTIWCRTATARAEEEEKRDSNSFYITLSQASSFFSFGPRIHNKGIFRDERTELELLALVVGKSCTNNRKVVFS